MPSLATPAPLRSSVRADLGHPPADARWRWTPAATRRPRPAAPEGDDDSIVRHPYSLSSCLRTPQPGSDQVTPRGSSRQAPVSKDSDPRRKGMARLWITPPPPSAGPVHITWAALVRRRSGWATRLYGVVVLVVCCRRFVGVLGGCLCFVLLFWFR